MTVAEELTTRLREVADGTVCAVLLYGSHLLQTSPDRHSAVDLVVVVDDYRAFYAALARAGELHRPVSVMTRLSRVLPPNVLAFAPDEGEGGVAKYLLVSRADLDRATGRAAPDHFLLSRMIQRMAVLWTADGEVARWLEGTLTRARTDVLWWVAPFVDGPFDPADLGRRMLEVCYRGEFRPESTARAGRVFEAQADHFERVLGPVLESAASEGLVERAGAGTYRLAAPPTGAEARRVARYFRRSKARATARWLKHTVTFVNWLPYIQRKVERHTGRPIRLTRLERKLPILFLWPRVVHVLLTRPRRETGS